MPCNKYVNTSFKKFKRGNLIFMFLSPHACPVIVIGGGSLLSTSLPTSYNILEEALKRSSRHDSMSGNCRNFLGERSVEGMQLNGVFMNPHAITFITNLCRNYSGSSAYENSHKACGHVCIYICMCGIPHIHTHVCTCTRTSTLNCSTKFCF